MEEYLISKIRKWLYAYHEPIVRKIAEVREFAILKGLNRGEIWINNPLDTYEEFAPDDFPPISDRQKLEFWRIFDEVMQELVKKYHYLRWDLRIQAVYWLA